MARLGGAAHAAILVLYLAAAGWLAWQSATPSPPETDATSYLRFAYNLSQHRTFSEQRELRPGQAPAPSMRREPGYPLVLAAAQVLGVRGAVPSLDCLLRGAPECADALRALKRADAVLYVVLSLAVFAVVFYLFRNPWPAYGALLFMLVNTSLTGEIGALYSEILAALLLFATSFSMAQALGRPEARAGMVLLAGLSFAALMLTKAIYFYVGPLFCLLMLWAALGRRPSRMALKLLAVMVIAYGLAGLWVARNYRLFDTPAVTQSRCAIATRAELTYMSWDEYRLAFLAFIPGVSQDLAEHFVDRSRIERLYNSNPQSYATRACWSDDGGHVARHAGVAGRLSSLGLAAYQRAVDRAGLDLLRQRWLKNLLMTPLFAYRGAILPNGFGYAYVREAAPALSSVLRVATMPLLLLLVPSLFLVFVVAARRGQAWWLAFTGPSVCAYLLMALLTHFQSRYAQPMIPALLPTLVAALWWLRRGRRDGAPFGPPGSPAATEEAPAAGSLSGR